MVAIDRAGRIVIPKEVRERLDLVADTELDLSVEGDSIRIARRERPVRRLEWTDDGRPWFPPTDAGPLTDLDVQHLRDAEQR